MSSSRRLVLGVAVLLSTVLAALPFKKQLLNKEAQNCERLSDFRWREARASVPTPLKVREGESPAKELHASVANRQRATEGERENWVKHPVTIRETSKPPRIPETYRPLLQPGPAASPPEGIRMKGTATAENSSGPEDRIETSSDGVTKPDDTRIIRHRIRDGDTLQALAAKYLGDPGRHQEIYEANKDRLPSEEVLPLNLTIEIYVPR